MSFTAILLAGSRPGRDPLLEAFGTELKALVPVGGEPMIVRPARALLESSQVARILVLAQQAQSLSEVLPKDERIEVRTSQETIAQTLLSLIDGEEVEWPLLVTTADHALLTPAMIDEFCRATGTSDVAMGVVRRASLLRRLPGTKRTWLKFRAGAYTGANLFALQSPAVRPAIELWRSVEQDRKKAWRLLSIIGPAALLAAALRLVSIDEVLAQLGARLGLRLKAVRLSNPLAGIDVDKPEDHDLVEAILAGKA